MSPFKPFSQHDTGLLGKQTMGTRIERAFRIGFALALVVFLGARTVVYRSTKHLLDIDRLIEHSQEVLREAGCD